MIRTYDVTLIRDRFSRNESIRFLIYSRYPGVLEKLKELEDYLTVNLTGEYLFRHIIGERGYVDICPLYKTEEVLSSIEHLLGNYSCLIQ